MKACTDVTNDMLPNRVAVKEHGEVSFEKARELADRTVRDRLSAPMLMAWFDRKTGAFSPQVECCSEEKPGWVVYAESRGGSLTVDVNDGAYYFVYRDFDEPESTL